METKRTHFKMYKDGRKWVFACAVMLAIGGGGMVTANASATESSSNVSVSSSSVGSAESDSGGSSESNSGNSNASTSSDDSNRNSSSSSSTDSNSGLAQAQSESTDVSSAKATSETGSQKQKSKVASESSTAKIKSVKKSVTSNKHISKMAHTVTKASGINARLMTPQEGLSTALANAKLREKVNALVESAQAKYVPATTTALEPLAEAEIQSGGTVYDDYPDLDNLLGVSSVFHIFAREAELHAHTNGNVAVQNLIGNVNFGTNIIEELLDKDISYIQNITNIAGSSFVSGGDTRENKVVFGDGISIDISNPNRPMVNGVYIDHLLANEVYQDQNGQTYIDFDAEFAKLKTLNESLANKASEASYSNGDFADQNNRVIDVSDMTPNANGQIVINLSPDVLQGNTPLYIKGLSPDAEGNTVIINVDTGGQADYTINSQIKLTYSDGTDRDNQETEHFGDNHLLWNFYDSTASDKQYGGEINVNAPFQGSMLAPSATIVANQNIDGNIIADKVIVKAETHRWDLQGNGDNEEEETFEKPVHPGINVELPNIEKPETPGPENPGTEEPGITEPGDEGDLTYEHEHPNYTEDEVVTDYWDDLIADEADTPSAAHAREAALLQRVDQAIAAARAQGNAQRVAQLQALKNRILADLGGLPQTGEAQNKWAPVVGAALLASLLGTLGAVIIKKRRD
ncbi:collagen-binding domain-containing protein [Levilactobacillus sp. N40-8-2]|uniref:collagen-binding domain-containing protein n=1 Tax=Levilactobacillus muriae TaxID=3238987 RepID=UPI0038B37F3F